MATPKKTSSTARSPARATKAATRPRPARTRTAETAEVDGHESPVPRPREIALSVSALTKKFRHGVTAVDDLSFEIPTGQVTGFVGPNGAGKTTTIRLLMGLIKPTSGTGAVLGHSISHPSAYLKDVGALIEEPAFYPGLSGMRNLLVHCRLRGIDAGRIPATLSAVGLTEAASRSVGTYSTGMKKRLAIAGALLPNPTLLILDEPANGLDPMGIRDVRQLLRHLADQGRTVFVSSHLLTEVEQACDEVVVIQKGRLAFQGPLDQLLHTEEAELVVAAEKPAQHQALRKLCSQAGYPAEQRGDRVYVRAPAAFAGELNRLAMKAGITLVELRRERLDLERVFFDLTADDNDRQEVPA